MIEREIRTAEQEQERCREPAAKEVEQAAAVTAREAKSGPSEDALREAAKLKNKGCVVVVVCTDRE